MKVKNADEFVLNIRKKGYISGISADCKFTDWRCGRI